MGKSSYNNVFIKKCRNTIVFKNIVKTYFDMANRNSCSIEDIRSLSAEDKLVKINMEILNKKRERINHSQDGIMSFTAFVIDNDEYIIILSIDYESPRGQMIYRACFGDEIYEKISLFEFDSAPSFVAANRIAEDMVPLGQSPAEHQTYVDIFRDIRKLDRFYLTDELDEAIKSQVNIYDNNLKTAITMEIGKVICEKFFIDKIYIKAINEGGNLRHIPVIYDKNEDEIEQFTRIRDQYDYAKRCDNCTNSLITKKAGYDYTEYAHVTIEYFDEHMYDDFLKTMNFKDNYCIPPYENENVPIVIRTDIVGGKVVMTYEYNKDYISDSDIFIMHEHFIENMHKRFIGENEEANSLGKALSDVDLRRREAGLRIMSKLSFFNTYQASELNNLVGKLEIKHLYMQQYVIREGADVDGIYIPVSGAVEVSMKDEEAYYKPLMLVGTGDVIGIESMLTNNTSKVAYHINSNDAIFFYISKAQFEKEVAKKPELMIKLLDIQSERLARFQKLWSLD